MPYCDCEDDGEKAYRYSRYSYETQSRLNDARYGGDECDREFAAGYRSEAIRDERRQEEQAAEEAREHRYAELRRQQEREEAEYYEQQMGYEQQ